MDVLVSSSRRDELRTNTIGVAEVDDIRDNLPELMDDLW